jgi:signal transduction histidine kinase
MNSQTDFAVKTNKNLLQIKRSIRFKLLSTTLSLFLIVLICFTGIQIAIQKSIAKENMESRISLMRQNLIQQGSMLSKLLVIQVENEIATYNFSKINTLIDNTIKESVALQYAILTDLLGTAYVDTENPALQQTRLQSQKDLFAIMQDKTTYKEYPESNIIEYITPIRFGKPWGVLRLGFTTNELEKEISRSIEDMNIRIHEILLTSIAIAVVFLLLASVIILIISNSISKPVMSLTRLSQELGKGNFDVAINSYNDQNKIDKRTEIGLLATSFIEMANEIKESHNQLEDYSHTLEEKVQRRTEELLQSEKMAALGQLIAGIAHEINTPLGAISSSASNMSSFLEQTVSKMPELFQSFSKPECIEFSALLKKSFENKHGSLSAKEQRQIRRNLVSRLENLVDDPDSVADTLVDMGIYDDLDDIVELLKRANGVEVLDLGYKLSELKRGTLTINMATERASKIVFALKSYAHQDDSGEMIPASITRGIDTILTLYQSQLKHGIELIKNYEEALPEIYCYPDELNQVWTNLIHNALYAMNYKGILSISVTRADEFIKVGIQDSGKGIEPENMSKIFDAFFTTKSAGEGSGLGLHIIKKIIDKHSGHLDVESEPGCTVFSVFLPVNKTEK